MVRLTDRPDMTIDVYRGRKTTNQQPTSTTLMIYEPELRIRRVLRIIQR